MMKGKQIVISLYVAEKFSKRFSKVYNSMIRIILNGQCESID